MCVSTVFGKVYRATSFRAFPPKTVVTIFADVNIFLNIIELKIV